MGVAAGRTHHTAHSGQQTAGIRQQAAGSRQQAAGSNTQHTARSRNRGIVISHPKHKHQAPAPRPGPCPGPRRAFAAGIGGHMGGCGQAEGGGAAPFYLEIGPGRRWMLHLPIPIPP